MKIPPKHKWKTATRRLKASETPTITISAVLAARRRAIAEEQKRRQAFAQEQVSHLRLNQDEPL